MMPSATAADAATTNPEARTAVAAVVLGCDLDLLVLLAAVPLAIFDPQIGEVELLIEVGGACSRAHSRISASVLSGCPS